MYNKKLKAIVVMFLVGLAGVIYFGCNTSGYTSEKDDKNIIFNEAVIDDLSTAAPTKKPDKEMCQVYICGFVKKPGVYTLEAGSRLYEYLELAGGYAGEADTEYENLARILSDGEKVYFPSKEQVKDGGFVNNSNSNGYDNGGVVVKAKVNINTAGVDELTTLTGIGESRAQSIIAYRQANGRFEAIEDIMLVNGIKQSVYDKIKEQITV